MRLVRGRATLIGQLLLLEQPVVKLRGGGDAINTISPFSEAPLWRRKVTREGPVNVAARDPPPLEAPVFTNRL